MGDMGAELALRVSDDLRELAAKKGLTRANQLKGALADRLAAEFPTPERDPFDDVPSCVLFVGINGAGKTTTCGKLAGRAAGEGRRVLLGGADTFRAAAIEQLEVWGERAGVDVITRERGCDPASVCYDVIEEAERRDADLVLIDTAGRLHTSADLMQELAKVVNVTRKRAKMPVSVVLVIDATTGQNGLQPGQGVQRRPGPRRPHHHQARRHRQGWHRPCRLKPAGPAHLPHRRGRVHRRPAVLRRARLLCRSLVKGCNACSTRSPTASRTLSTSCAA